MSLDFKAVELFNSIKEQYQRQIKVLTTLKQQVTKTDQLDQGQKSQLRIQIESVLIDVNEEIFAISEELATAFQMTKSEQNSQELYRKAQEFEQKKIKLLSKIRQSISNNPSTLILKGQEDRVSESPPQKEKSPSGVMNILRNYSNSNERKENSNTDLVDLRSLNLPRQSNHESVETFGHVQSPHRYLKRQQEEVIKRSLQPSPGGVPLRNRNNVLTPENLVNRRSGRSGGGSRNGSKSSHADRRNSNRSISRGSLSTKMALNQLYSVKKKGSKKQMPRVIPKYSGCGPGGINGSLVVLKKDTSDSTLKTMQTMENIRSSKPILPNLLKKQNSYQDIKKKPILQQNDKNLKQARQETYKLLKQQTQDSRPASSLSNKNLRNSFSKKLYQRSQSGLSQYDEKQSQSMQATFENSYSKPQKEFKPMLTETSDAVVQFSKDFDLMRKKFGEMHQKMQDYQENIQTLKKQVKTLQDENLKLNTDIKVIRTEHSEMAHTVYKLEQKNQGLIEENQQLRQQVYGHAPLRQPNSFQAIIESPFSNVMQKRYTQENPNTAGFPSRNNSQREIQQQQPIPPPDESYMSNPPIQKRQYVSVLNEASEVKNEVQEEEEELSEWVLQRLKNQKGLKV